MDRFVKILGIAVLLAGGIAFSLVSGTSHPLLASQAGAKTAQDVYLDKCSVCHAKDGSGNTAKGRKLKAKDLRSPEVQKLSDVELIKDVSQGTGKDMDGFEKELGADMVKQLVAYCRSLAKP